MSPLRSLFALAALLAVPSTQAYNCAYRTTGMPIGTIIEYQPQTVPAPYFNLQIPTDNCPKGLVVVGQTVQVCNNDIYGPAPILEGPPLGKYSPVIVTCTTCPQDSTAHITQWCGSLPPIKGEGIRAQNDGIVAVMKKKFWK